MLTSETQLKAFITAKVSEVKQENTRSQTIAGPVINKKTGVTENAKFLSVKIISGLENDTKYFRESRKGDLNKGY